MGQRGSRFGMEFGIIVGRTAVACCSELFRNLDLLDALEDIGSARVY